MYPLEINQKLKIIPKEIKKISTGIITKIESPYFIVSFQKNNFFEVNTVVEIIIFTEICLIKTETEIAKIEGNSVYLVIPEEFSYIQRREYSRVDINIPVNLTELNNPENKITLMTKNLSGGGMQLISPKIFDKGVLFGIEFEVFDKKNITGMLEILRIDKNCQNNNEILLSGRFKELANLDRITIIQLCFKRQLELKYKDIKSGVFC
ncbi:MAG: PilZ domain-containing protein [bacterium]